jgi:4-hydroxy-4-methyl-2-oxoglutarate aldolase
MRGPQPLGHDQHVAGRARTQQLVALSDPQQTASIADRARRFELVDEALEGDFLVIADANPAKLATFGDVLGLKATARGVVGLVVDGAVRDVAILNQLRLPVWANAVTPIPPVHGDYTVRSVNEPVTCAGVSVQAGDFIVADRDGIVVIQPDEAAPVVILCQELTDHESSIKDAISRGEKLKDLDFNGTTSAEVTTPSSHDRVER